MDKLEMLKQIDMALANVSVKGEDAFSMVFARNKIKELFETIKEEVEK